MTDDKQGFFRKLGGGSKRYISKRFGNEYIKEVGRDNLKGSYEAAREAMRLEKISKDELKRGIYGRYADGGRSRFKQVMSEQGVKEEDLPTMVVERRRNALIMFLSAIGFLAFGAWSIFGSGTDHILIYVMSTLIASLILFALSLRHDFARWQLENRRFGSFAEYFVNRSYHSASEKRSTSLKKN